MVCSLTPIKWIMIKMGRFLNILIMVLCLSRPRRGFGLIFLIFSSPKENRFSQDTPFKNIAPKPTTCWTWLWQWGVMPEEEPMNNQSRMFSFGTYIMLNIESSSMSKKSFSHLEILSGARKADIKQWGWIIHMGSHMATRHGVACCLTEGRLQRLADTPPNYQSSCVAVSYYPRYPAAEKALPILSTQDLANLITYDGE